jgi:hypothetical protein
MFSLLPSVIVLGTAAVVATYLTQSRPSPPENAAERAGAARVFVLALALMVVHVVEEATTGLPARFPAIFGLPPVSLSAFLTINVSFIAICIASIPGLRAGRPGAFWVAWFLALAGYINLVGHPLMALVEGSVYFPGLVSSPFVGAAGIWLWRRLDRATRPSAVVAG